MRKQLYNLIKTLGINTYYNRPEVLRDFPCITYSVGGIEQTHLLNKEVGKVDSVFDVDVFAENSEDCENIASQVDELLRANSYIVEALFDIPEDDAFRINMRIRYIS